MESHLQSAMGPHLDVTCVKLNNTQVELKNAQERIRKLEQQVKFKDEQEAVRKLEQQVELKNAQETIRKLKEKFHTRKMLWKINEFSRIMKEAKNEEKKYIESDPFYTEIPGYKLKVLFCPNGFGSGENTHLSVYIVLMKGEYDALLPWPFNRKVTFTLIDQDEDLLKRKNVVAELTPDHVIPGATSRPRRGENVGRGMPRFISHRKLQARSYVTDDTLFLQVEIDHNDRRSCCCATIEPPGKQAHKFQSQDAGLSRSYWYS